MSSAPDSFSSITALEVDLSPPDTQPFGLSSNDSSFKLRPSKVALSDVVLWVCRTYPLLLLALGTAGNALNLVVMGRTCPHTSIGTLLRAIAIGNLVPLYFYILPLWIEYTFGYNLKSSSIPVCKLIPFINYVGTDVAIILLIFSNLDRLIACWNPLRASRYCTVRIALLEIAGVTCFAVLLNITTPIIRTITYPTSSSTSASTAHVPPPTQRLSTNFPFPSLGSDTSLRPEPPHFISSLPQFSQHITVSTMSTFTTISSQSLQSGQPSCTDKVDSHPLNWYQQLLLPWIVLVLVSVVPELCVLTFNVLLLAGLARHERRLRAFSLIQTTHITVEPSVLMSAGNEEDSCNGNGNGGGTQQRKGRQQRNHANTINTTNTTNTNAGRVNTNGSPLVSVLRPHSFSVQDTEEEKERSRASSILLKEKEERGSQTDIETEIHTERARSDTQPNRSITLDLPKSINGHLYRSSPNSPEPRGSPKFYNRSMNSNSQLCPSRTGNGIVHTDPVQKRDLFTKHNAAVGQSQSSALGTTGRMPLSRRTCLELNTLNGAVPRVASMTRIRQGGSSPAIGAPGASEFGSSNALQTRPRIVKQSSNAGNNGSASGSTTGNQTYGGGSSAKDRERTTYVLTLGISLLFLVLYTPILLLRPFEAYFVDKSLFRQLQTLLAMLQHTFHCADFYVYVAISRAYRQKLVRVLLGKSFQKTKWGGGATDVHQSRGVTETQTAPPMLQVTQMHR